MNIPFRVIPQYSLIFALLLSLVSVSASRSFAQEEKSGEPVVEIDEALLELKKQLKSPRQTVVTFLEAAEKQDYELARKCFDLSGLAPETEDAKYKTLAIKLNLIINEYGPNFDLAYISSDPEVEPPYSIMETKDQESIQLVPNKDGLWRFSKSTVEVIDSLSLIHISEPTRPY